MIVCLLVNAARQISGAVVCGRAGAARPDAGSADETQPPKADEQAKIDERRRQRKRQRERARRERRRAGR